MVWHAIVIDQAMDVNCTVSRSGNLILSVQARPRLGRRVPQAVHLIVKIGEGSTLSGLLVNPRDQNPGGGNHNEDLPRGSACARRLVPDDAPFVQGKHAVVDGAAALRSGRSR